MKLMDNREVKNQPILELKNHMEDVVAQKLEEMLPKVDTCR